MICSVVLLVVVAVVTALPDGAPVCLVGQPSLGVHENPTFIGNNTVVHGTIETGGFRVRIGDDFLDPSRTSLVYANYSYEVTVGVGLFRQFRGLLLVLSGPPGVNLENSLVPSLYSKRAMCTLQTPLISAVSHAEPRQRAFLTSYLHVESVQPDLRLDVSIVVAMNAQQGSIYYHSQYKLAAPTKAPTPAPTVPPTDAPRQSKRCGLFRLGIFCPIQHCGLFGRLLSLCRS